MDNLTQRKLSQAIQLHQKGKYPQALQSYNEILRKLPNETEVLHLSGLALSSLSKFDEAISSISKAIRLKPNDAFYCSLGNVFFDKGDLGHAIEAYKNAIQFNGNNLEAFNNLGMIFTQQNMYNEAIMCYHKAIEIAPQVPEIYNNLGTVYFNSKRIEEAIKCHHKAIEIKPDYAEAYFNLGNDFKPDQNNLQSTKNIENIDKAIFCYQKVLELSPNFADAYVNLGLMYYLKGQTQQELQCYELALKLMPNSAEILNSIGVIYKDSNNIEKAIEYLQNAISVSPNYADAHINLAICYFIKKDYEKAFKHYSRRLDNFDSQKKRIEKYSQPLWDGGEIEGKTIYVHHEQGFGDTINFCRFLPVLAEKCAKVLLRPQKELESLFQHNIKGFELVSNSTPDEALTFDTHTLLMYLMEHLNVTPENIPSSEGYLTVDDAKVQYFKEKYFDNNDFKLGINWNCGNAKFTDQFRSISDINAFFPFAKIDGVKVYSFQKGVGEEQLENLPGDIEIINLGKDFNDFTDTAAALKNLDLLISVDTSVPHLAGAMGVPTWVMLQYVPDWRWTTEGETSFWYDSVKLFRQDSEKQWQLVVDRVFEEFVDKINNNH